MTSVPQGERDLRDAPGPGITVAAVARRLGVAPATLRTWDRRYGLGPSSHEAGSHRRYTREDLARLDHMRRLIISGVPPAEAAQAALALDVDAGAGEPLALPTRLVPAPPTARPAGEGSRGHGGGQVIAIPGGAPAARGLARAAQALDTAACRAIIRETLDRRGVMWTWDHLLVPVLVAVGEQWSQSGRGVEVEHALSDAIETALKEEVTALSSPINERAVLLASAPDDEHTLAITAIAAALAERRIAARILGANLPTDSLQQAVGRVGPAAVFLWAQIPGSADIVSATRIPATRPRAVVIVGGQGWFGEAPDDVVQVFSLDDAVAQIAHAVGA